MNVSALEPQDPESSKEVYLQDYANYETCPYNSVHRYPPQSRLRHLCSCPDRPANLSTTVKSNLVATSNGVVVHSQQVLASDELIRSAAEYMASGTVYKRSTAVSFDPRQTVPQPAHPCTRGPPGTGLPVGFVPDDEKKKKKKKKKSKKGAGKKK
eukprot:gnl/Spiro4/28213_TR13960_c0_g1_i1.p1 gnl/Spiro4/28213_TR13960_c0_g1~~gnl/Spiro4/28213_TR13960_c0_g1_i1.p1  ORF type:complete len:155 (+),score=21.12 gnl/Spiro4/28213_TR13960_c0_g1_i1:53-517(+)